MISLDKASRVNVLSEVSEVSKVRFGRLKSGGRFGCIHVAAGAMSSLHQRRLSAMFPRSE